MSREAANWLRVAEAAGLHAIIDVLPFTVRCAAIPIRPHTIFDVLGGVDTTSLS